MLLAKLMLLVLPLASYKDHKRVLLVFGAGTGGQIDRQLELLKGHKADLSERDVVVLAEPDESSASAQLRAQFHVSGSEFTVILIGKDGGEKLRQHSSITYEKLASTIDAMPMRQDEMRGKK